MSKSPKNILITGASRGIGRATAVLAGQRGWNVAINYAHNEAAANEAQVAVTSAGGRAITVQGDVSLEDDVLAMFDAAIQAFGPMHGFVNNAGIVAPAMPLSDMDAARIRQVLDINIYGAYLCAREAARCMSTRHGGVGGAIVNLSSIAARLGSPNEYVDYAGSKGAIDSMTIGLAKELGPEGIRVNAVRPGLIDTEIHADGGNAERAKELGAGTPLGRAGTAEEVAEAIIWLLSDNASYVSGTLLDVGGGR